MPNHRWSEYVRIPKQLVMGKLSPKVSAAQLNAVHLLWSIRHFDGEEHVLPERWTKTPDQQKRAIANLKVLLKRKADAWIEVGGEKIPLIVAIRTEPAHVVKTKTLRWCTVFGPDGNRRREQREIPGMKQIPARLVVTQDPRIIAFFRGMKRTRRAGGTEFAKLDVVKAEKLPTVAAKRLFCLAVMHAGRHWPHWTSKVDALFGIIGEHGRRKDKATAAFEAAAKVVERTFHVRYAALSKRKLPVPIKDCHLLKHAPVYKGNKLVAFRFMVIDRWLDISKQGKLDVEIDLTDKNGNFENYAILPALMPGWRQGLLLQVSLNRLHKRKAPQKPTGFMFNLHLTEEALRDKWDTPSLRHVVRRVDEYAYPVAWAQEYDEWKDGHDRHEAAREDVERAAAKGSNWAAEQLYQRQRLSEHISGVDPDHLIETLLEYPG
jgi:hypothetical protein